MVSVLNYMRDEKVGYENDLVNSVVPSAVRYKLLAVESSLVEYRTERRQETWCRGFS